MNPGKVGLMFGLKVKVVFFRVFLSRVPCVLRHIRKIYIIFRVGVTYPDF